MMLGKVIAGYRRANRIGIRALAKQVGTSHGTLSRVENGKPCDSTTLSKLFLWLLSGEPSFAIPRKLVEEYRQIKTDYNFFDGDRHGHAAALTRAEEAIIAAIPPVRESVG